MTPVPALGDGLRLIEEAVRDVENLILRSEAATDADIAEGYLYLMGLWRWAVDRAFTGLDDNKPRFVRYLDSFARRGHENPDNRYLSAQIDPRGIYRISGNRGSHADLVFEVVTGVPGDGGRAGDSIDSIDARRLHADADGHYEIIVGGDPTGANHLKTRDGARAVFVRQTWSDWSEYADAPSIERIDPGDYDDPVRPGGDMVIAQCRSAAQMMVDHARFLNEVATAQRATQPMNGLTAPSTKVGNGFMPGQYSSVGQFDLGPDEALLIEVSTAKCRYSGVALCHYHWFASLDPRTLLSSLSDSQTRLSADGVCRYVVSAEDPGAINWLETSGHARGFVMLRWHDVEGPAPCVTGVERVRIGDLPHRMKASDFLPAQDRAALRAAARRKRRQALDRRFI